MSLYKDEVDEEEALAIHREVAKDFANGEVKGHLDDFLDELHSKPIDPIETERIRADRERELRVLMRAIKTGVSEALLPKGIICHEAYPEEDDLIVRCHDRDQRIYEIKVNWDKILELEALNDPRKAMAAIVDMCCVATLNSRDWYFARMGRGEVQE